MRQDPTNQASEANNSVGQSIRAFLGQLRANFQELIPTPHKSTVVLASETAPQAIADSGIRLELRPGVKLVGQFTEEERRSINLTIDKFESLVGSFKDLNLEVRKKELPFKNLDQILLNLESGHPLKGLGPRAQVDVVSHQLSIHSKVLLDHANKWEKDNLKRARGEELREHDFIWSFAHEVAHVLSFKFGIGNQLMQPFQPKDLSPILKEWFELSRYIHYHPDCREISHRESGQDVRPKGYPTHYSYFATSGRGNDHEIFADTAAYVATNATYAKDDEIFAQRISAFHQICARLKAMNSSST